MYIETTDELRELYDFPKGRAKAKVLNELEEHSQKFIQLSPFVVMATRSSIGTLDSSPRGGEAGFIKVFSNTRILIPDSRGNNRLDSLTNIVETGYCGCLFLVPGVDETLRINGTARISTAAQYLAIFANQANPPKSCIELTVQEVFLHCAKALMRSELWSAESRINRSLLPTMGRMLNDQLDLSDEPESQENMIERYRQDL
jgi:PPOX class probable FMN-dependent enzyme